MIFESRSEACQYFPCCKRDATFVLGDEAVVLVGCKEMRTRSGPCWSSSVSSLPLRGTRVFVLGGMAVLCFDWQAEMYVVKF